MKLGTCVIFNEMEGLDEKFKNLRKNGFDSCQLLAWNPTV